MPTIQDLTFRTDRTGNVIISQRGEHVCNVVQMMFNTVPGSDQYNAELGLNIAARKKRSHVNGTRDTKYESDIVHQFTTYTDLVPLQVIVFYKDDRMIIYMKVRYLGTIYEVDVTEGPDTLTAVLRNR